MNPNNSNINTNQFRPTFQSSSLDNYTSSETRIETTQYIANQNPSSHGITPQNYQTVNFSQQPINQVTNLNRVFKPIPEEKKFIMRDDLNSSIDHIKKLTKKVTFDINLDSSQKLHYCLIHKEENSNIVYKNDQGKITFINNFCDICLEDFNYEEKGFKNDHFTSILRKRKEELLALENDDFSRELHIDNMWNNLKNLILKNAVKAIDYTYYFKKNFMDNISQTPLSEKDVNDLRKFLANILDKNKSIDFRGIGEKPQLKQQYISLALYLLTYQKDGLNSINFSELEQSLKKFILEIYNLRQETYNDYTEWLKLSIENYKNLCNFGNLTIDNAFLSTINVDFYSGVKVEIRESSEYMQKYNDLLLKYNIEIKTMEQTIYNLRNSSNLNVQEVKIY
jgi:hypothetical protein